MLRGLGGLGERKEVINSGMKGRSRGCDYRDARGEARQDLMGAVLWRVGNGHGGTWAN